MCDTKTYEVFVRSLMGSHLNERACYALGLAGEAGEVCAELLDLQPSRLVKLEKELGDVCWYVVALAAQFELDCERLWYNASVAYERDARPHHVDLGMRLAADAGRAVDSLKKHWGHGKALSRSTLGADLADVLRDIIWISDVAGLTMHNIRATNVAKLSARFPAGCFSTQAANAYADREATKVARELLSPSQLTGPAHVCGMHCEGQDGRCDMRSRPDKAQPKPYTPAPPAPEIPGFEWVGHNT